MGFRVLLLVLAVICSLILPPTLFAQEEFQSEIKRYPYQYPDRTVIGNPTWHAVGPKDTILDIAREYGLGYNELHLLYPRMDPWIPPRKRALAIPTYWVLPPSKHEQLVINLPELRLYFLDKKTSTVQTYPLGIGDEGWESPLGTFRITEKRPNPTWYIPKSLQAKYGMSSMPPGPGNPLGKYMMKFSAGAYGIHGTHIPWGVGRLVSHGCIRCYPEHIRLLFPQVKIGTILELIYEPIKFGKLNGQVFVEVHPDVYKRMPDFLQHALAKLREYPYAHEVDESKYLLAVYLKSGVPINISRESNDDLGRMMIDMAN